MTILLLIFSFCLLAGIFCFFREDKRLTEIQQTLTDMQSSWETLKEEHQALVNADLHFSKALKTCNSQINNIDQQLLELSNVRANDGGYQHALHILDLGGTREEIMNSCHLTAAEADLLMNMHAYKIALQQNTVC